VRRARQPGSDTALGGPDAAFVRTRDGEPDAVADCGDGEDNAVADNALDRIVACDVVAPQLVTRATLLGPFEMGGLLRFAPTVLSGSPATLTRGDGGAATPTAPRAVASPTRTPTRSRSRGSGSARSSSSS